MIMYKLIAVLPFERPKVSFHPMKEIAEQHSQRLESLGFETDIKDLSEQDCLNG
jgi:hypothetical protein